MNFGYSKYLFLISFLSATIFHSNLCLAQKKSVPQTSNQKEKKDNFSWVPVNYTKNNIDTKSAIVQNLQKVKSGEMSAKQFYQELAKIPMPEGKEPRHVLMEIKKEILQQYGPEGLAKVLGPQFKEGGTPVERILLSERKKIVMQGINETIKHFQGQNLRNGHRFSVYYAPIGSWMSELPKQMQFAGDIDFSFICADLKLATDMKNFFDIFIKREIHMTPENLDAPCTVHGQATPEVFVGKHGQEFAEGSIKQVKRIDTGGNIDSIPFTPFQHALENMLLESKYASNPLPDIRNSKWKGEPGISLEMIRHFEHDITSKNVFTNLESFMKAAKYVKRSNDAVKNAGGSVNNDALSKLCDDLIANKKQPHQVQSDIIRAYFERINQPLPIEVKLKPESGGKSALNIEINEKIIRKFWDDCSKAMWENASKGFDAQLKHIKSKTSTADSAIRFVEELDQMREMIEIEMRVLNDQKVGVKNIDADFYSKVQEFRSLCKEQFKGKNLLHLLPIEDRKTFQFIEENLKRGQPINIQLALGALINVSETLNNYLDLIDETLLGEIRANKMDWKTYLIKANDLTWAKKTDQFLGRWTLSERQKAFLNLVNRQKNIIEIKMNDIIANSAATRGVRNVNQIINRSFESSTAGQLSMKALTAINLANEIPVYIDLAAKEDWSGLAAEFIIRRVPLGSAANNLYMGRYMLAVWDVGVTIVPPAALLELTYRISEWTAEQSWQIMWSEELDKFTDDLYENAEFQLIKTEEIDGKIELTQWKLKSVTYKGEKFDDIPAFIKLKQRHIEEMHEQCALPLNKRDFPMRYTQDGITDWLNFGWILRENIVNQDPFLVFIDELKKNPIVGEKLKRHYLDLWYTRFEQVKLDYILHMIKMLEERRSAEKAYISGQLPLITTKLTQLAANLQISDQMDDNLENEMGGTIYSLYTWVRDWALGIKRSLSDEAAVWEHDKECVRILQRYLKAYIKIEQIRNDMESKISTEKKGDFGLRILTGPLMLTGEPQNDTAQAAHWLQLFQKTRSKVLKELTSIKNRHSTSRGGLDTDPKSYDQRVLKSVTTHDFWGEVWKYIYRNAPKETWSVFDEGLTVKIYQMLKTAAMGKGDDIEEIAQGHHSFHKKQRDKIIKSFEDYYFQEKFNSKQNQKDNKPAFVKKSKEATDNNNDETKKKTDDTPQFVKKSKETDQPEPDDKPAFVKKSLSDEKIKSQPFDPTKDPFEIKSVAMETIDVVDGNKSYEILKTIDVAIIVRSRGEDHILDGKFAFDLLLKKGYFYYKKNVGYIVSEKFVNFDQASNDKPAAPKQEAKKQTKKNPIELKKGFTKDNEYYLESYRASLESYKICQEDYGENCAFRFEDIRDSFPLITNPDPDPQYSPFGNCAYDRDFVDGYERYKELKKEGYDVSRLYCESYNTCYYATPEGYPGKNPVKLKLPYKQIKRPPAGQCKDPYEGLY